MICERLLFLVWERVPNGAELSMTRRCSVNAVCTKCQATADRGEFEDLEAGGSKWSGFYRNRSDGVGGHQEFANFLNNSRRRAQVFS